MTFGGNATFCSQIHTPKFRYEKRCESVTMKKKTTMNHNVSEPKTRNAIIGMPKWAEVIRQILTFLPDIKR